MKRLLIFLIVLLLLLPLAFSTTGCSSSSSSKIKIVATIFPVYDWVMIVLGDHAKEMDVRFLANNGSDMHSYSLSIADAKAIAESDLFLYVGGESDAWVKDALKNSTNKKMRTMNLLTLLGDKALAESTEGILAPEEEEEEEEEEDGAKDEHVWLSLTNAVYYVELIEKEIEAIDPSHASDYRENAAAYVAQLNELDAQYRQAVREADHDTILIADRFPFLYLTHDYGIKYYAAYSGCSANTAKLKDYKFLVDKVDELELKVLLILENSSDSLAKSIKNNSKTQDQEILVLDSLQSTTQKDYENGRRYLSVMEKNLKVLRKALAE